MNINEIIAQAPKRVNAFKSPEGNTVVMVNGERQETTQQAVNDLEDALLTQGYKVTPSLTLRGLWRATRPVAPANAWFSIETTGFTAHLTTDSKEVRYWDN